MISKYREKRQFKDSSDDIKAAVRYALQHIRISRKSVTWSDDRITFNIPMSWAGWGEKVTIFLEGNGNVEVFSKSVFHLYNVFQWYDWGKNKRNVRVILDWMENYFELKQ